MMMGAEMTNSSEGRIELLVRLFVERTVKFVGVLLSEAQKSEMCLNLLIIHH